LRADGRHEEETNQCRCGARSKLAHKQITQSMEVLT